jgi:hypothetical protein
MGNVTHGHPEALHSAFVRPRTSAAAGSDRGGQPGYWVEPLSHHAYPLEFEAYRRHREAEERPLPRHRGRLYLAALGQHAIAGR